MNVKRLNHIATLVLLTLVIFCVDIAYAKGPTCKICIDSADPPSALQGEEKDVYIGGSGFGPGSSVRYLVTGTKDDTQINVLSVEYLPATETEPEKLKTRIKVKGNAIVIDYDIEVRLANGRRGKGTTLFAVKQNQNGGGGSSEKGFKVKVTFDDSDGDTIRSDGNGPYFEFDGSGVGTEMPVEFSPPGQFTMWLKLAAIRHVFIDFGLAVDCDSEAPMNPGTDACVKDKVGDIVQCLFPPGKRDPAADDLSPPLDADTQCSGYKLISLGFRHTVDDSGAELEYMLGMTNNETFDGEGDNVEIPLREESKKEDDLRIRFDANCLGLGLDKGDFLKITAWDNVDNDGIPNDEWKIDTIDIDINGNPTTTKTACLTKKGNGKREDLVGLFDMQFGYTICILANQEPASALDSACLAP